MRNGVGEKFAKRSPGTSDTKKTKVLLTLKELGSDKHNDVDLKGSLCMLLNAFLFSVSLLIKAKLNYLSLHITHFVNFIRQL